VEAGVGFLIACGESPELFEPAEAAFDAIALPVELLIMHALLFSTAPGRDHRHCVDRFDVVHDAVRVVALVGDDRLGLPLAQQIDSLSTVVDLPGRDAEVDRLAILVSQQMDFGRQTSSGTPQSLVRAPFLRPVAACW